VKLILLYGPPAVGKLTIARELALLTGYTIFDNHMVLNLLSNIFGYNHPARKKLEKDFRTKIIKAAIKNNVDLIMTGVIVNANLDFYKNITELVKTSMGTCFIVQVTAPTDVLKDRVVNKSRRLNQKISTKDEWNNFYKMYPEVYDKFLDSKQLNLNTAFISPKEAAKAIEAYLLVALKLS
jgi:tRNA uridine 5-carbamoylmethylation protein Kti12